ncbi:restriction endonuclease [Streptomyces sp. NRRL S-87]|uniref:restriction endonuclease n=1 Tax=Streptomyces sp. NRRL S-87 TaxID=1463920 RepID=UPI0004C22C84|nr:restriction endonuclease [Streptomyces sp. NRRL S-87]
MSRRGNGVFATWAEAQHQLHQAQLVQQREAERRQRAHERDLARSRREQQAAHRQYREAEARRRTEELDAKVAALEGLLAAGCRAPAFRMSAMRRPEQVEPFAPGALARPIPMPDPQAFRAPSGGWSPGGGRRAQEEAHARYTQAWHAAQAAEADRQRRLADYRAQYDQWAASQLAEIRRHNDGLAETVAALRAGDPDAVVEYFSAALYASTAWPAELPRRLTAAYDCAARQLVVSWELPRYDVVPEARLVKYLPSVDQERETARPVTQRRALYRGTLAQCVLLVPHALFAADEYGVLDSVVVNGFVDDHDPVTGRRSEVVVATVTTSRSTFAGLHLAQVSPVDCLVEGLRGQLSTKPEQLAAVRPGRTPEAVGAGVVAHGPDSGGPEPDLHAMDPIEFEHLVAALFRAMGMEAVTTQRSNDGGVDVEAVDPAPIRGGRIVVQVKRYRNTVNPSAVRDLYGTVQSCGANKGVLVTTSRFGPSSHAFAEGKPLELVSGADLVELLHRHGLRGRLGDPAAPPAAAGAPPTHNILAMNWSGAVRLDVCALVCTGNRALGDDWFVFFNNDRTPDGSVRTRTVPAPDKAALEVAFEALPSRADRVVLVAAVDPDDPRSTDLAGFTDAHIRLLDAAGAEQGRLDVSDGRPGETALVLGSFRHRGHDDWDFVIGGKGYRGGLAELLADFGIEAA